MSRYSRYGINYLQEAQIAFLEVSSGIYKVAKSRRDMFPKGKYVETYQVIEALNSGEKVLLCRDNLQHILAANFTTEGVHQ